MSPHDNADRQSEPIANAVTAMKLDPDATPDTPILNGAGAMSKHDFYAASDASSPACSKDTYALSASQSASRPTSRSPVKNEPEGDYDHNQVSDEAKFEATETAQPDNMEEKVGGDISVKLEPGQPPKLTRSSSQKVAARPPQLFLHLPNSTAQAEETFEVMDACTYANKYMGYTEHAMECDCAEEWGKYSLSSFLRSYSFHRFPSLSPFVAFVPVGGFPRVALHFGSPPQTCWEILKHTTPNHCLFFAPLIFYVEAMHKYGEGSFFTFLSPSQSEDALI